MARLAGSRSPLGGRKRTVKGACRQGPRPRASAIALAATLIALAARPVLAVDKSGVSLNAINLPTGPGSIQGLGEAFQPSLNTGTASYPLILQVNPGTNEHNPDLKLQYEAGGENTPLGYGWDLPLPFVQRSSEYGMPRYVDGPNGVDDDLDGELDEPDEVDNVMDDQREVLLRTEEGYYFSRTEQAFVRYERVGDYWIGVKPNGTRLEFGRTAQARLSDAASGKVFRWLVERIIDTHGNTIVFTYSTAPGIENLNQRYVASIRYGAGAPPWPAYHFIRFVYEPRPDWFEDCRAGFIVRTGRRLTQLLMGTQGVSLSGHAAGDFDADGQPDFLSRRYDIKYEAHPYWSLLSEIRLTGADGATALPPLRFTYAVCDPPAFITTGGVTIGSVNEPFQVMDNDFVDLVDLNADGLPDILKTEAFGGSHTAYLNRGEAPAPGGRAIRWSTAREVAAADGAAWNFNLGSTLASNVTHLADMDGDGLADLAHNSAAVPNDAFFFRNLGNVGWGPREEMIIRAGDAQPPSPFSDDNVETADVDFNKTMDIIQSISVGFGADYRIWFNLGDGRYSQSVTVPQTEGLMFSQTGVHLTDLNGDRVPDVARVRATGIDVLPGLGYGRFADRVFIEFPDVTFSDGQIASAALEDVTGNGLPDLVLHRPQAGEIWYWLNRGNYTLEPRRILADLPPRFGSPEIRWADINGNGTTDLIIADSAANPKIQSMDLGRLMGCEISPNMLLSIDNGIGRRIEIEYAPTTRFVLADAAAGRPWPDPMPFSVEVVSKVTTQDSLGNRYVTRFVYHDGYYDPVFKHFRGFAEVDQIDEGDATAPTLIRVSHFDLGRDVYALKGKLLRETLRTEAGGVFQDERTTWTSRVLRTNAAGDESIYAHPVARRRDILELGQGVPRRLEVEMDFDDYGNQIAERDYGIVVDGDRSAFDDERITLSEFALNLTDWIVAYVSQIEIQDAAGRVYSRSRFYYDDPTFSGSNLGQVTRGDLTLKHEWIDPDDPMAFVATERRLYDAYGNVIALLDPLASAPAGVPQPAGGHYSENAYDAAFRTFPVRETLHVGGGGPPLVAEATFDPGLAVLLSSKEFNGHVTRYRYDGLGRLTALIKPGDSEAFPTTEIVYALAVPFGTGRVNYVETRELDRPPNSPGLARLDHYRLKRQYVDGLGRMLIEKSEAEEDPTTGTPRVVVRGAVRFNARAQPWQELQPHYAARPSNATLEDHLAYEDVGNPSWRGLFLEDDQLLTLDLAQAHKLTRRYDALSRPVEVVNADGTRSRTVYEPLATREFDENDADPNSPFADTPTVRILDGLERLARVEEITRLNDDGAPGTEPRTWSTTYTYDPNGRLLRLADAQGNVKLFDYDGLQRRTSVQDPNRGITTFAYDAASNLTETVDAKGQRILFQYDGLNRLLNEDYLDEGLPFSANRAPDVRYAYDAPAGEIDLGDGTRGTATNLKGQLAYVHDLSGETHFAYDARTRLIWTVRRLPDPETGAPTSFKTETRLDSLDRVTELIYPDNDRVTFAYNRRGKLERINGGSASNIGAAGFIFGAADYTPTGDIRAFELGNGLATRYGFDRRLRTRSLRSFRLASPAEPLLAYEYDFDAATNITRIRDQRPGSVRPSGDPLRNTQLLLYDDLYRLREVNYSRALPGEGEPIAGTLEFRYDRVGNIIAQFSDIPPSAAGGIDLNPGTFVYGGAAGSHDRQPRQPGDPPGPHAVTQAGPNRSLAYDDNGNVVTLDGRLFTWDFKDRLVAVEDERMRAEYVYDYDDRRVFKKVWLKGPGGALPDRPSNFTLYVDRYFEVAQHRQPIKYVWRGRTRVARVTGTLDPAARRVQRLPAHAGWNLFSMAVQSDTALAQLGLGSNPAVQAVARWDSALERNVPLQAGQPLPPGSVFWLNASSPVSLAVLGAYADPARVVIPAGEGFVATTGLETIARAKALPTGARAIWAYDAQTGRWAARLPARPDFVSFGLLPDFLEPGRAVYLETRNVTSLTPEPPPFRIQYYLQDHLESGNVLTDAAGAVIEETVFFPYGEPRARLRARPADVALRPDYLFSQKERDEETGLQYFEARYLIGSLGRFNRVDPLALEMPENLLTDPQALNAYAYGRNNPIMYRDPDGEIPVPLAPATPAFVKFVGIQNIPFRAELIDPKDKKDQLAHKIADIEKRRKKLVEIGDATIKLERKFRREDNVLRKLDTVEALKNKVNEFAENALKQIDAIVDVVEKDPQLKAKLDKALTRKTLSFSLKAGERGFKLKPGKSFDERVREARQQVQDFKDKAEQAVKEKFEDEVKKELTAFGTNPP